MKPNYFVFCTMITLFCFSTIAMEQPSSKKNINYRVWDKIAKLQGPAEQVLEYVEDEYGFKVIASFPSVKRKSENDGQDISEPSAKRLKTE